MANQNIETALRGISGVHVTPYDKDGAVDTAMLTRVVDRIATAGIHNIVSAGNTGEFYALTMNEVELVHDTALQANHGRVMVTAAVGRSLRDAIALGRRAKSAGANAIMAHQPLDPFAAPHSQAAYFSAIADSVDLPLIAYVRSDHIKSTDLVALADHPNVVAIKFATPNLMLLADCIRASGPRTAIWVCGLAEGWAPAFYAAGARGFTSGLVNVDPARSLAIHRALELGDYAKARTLVDTISTFETLRTHYNNGANVTVVKEALEIQGWPMGRVRQPGLPSLDPEHRNQLTQVLSMWAKQHFSASPV